jgi:hypothetical protein
LLAALDHKPAAPRFVELVDFPRAEVRVAAAWGAKTLAVPETVPALLAAAQRLTEKRMGSDPEANATDLQTAHLLELFGKTKYREAELLLRRYIPKEMRMGMRSRAAAIWSLGFLHEGVPDEDIARQLLERLLDDGIPPEARLVRKMSVVTIARMKAAFQVPALRKIVSPKIMPGEIAMTIRWALIELTGEAIAEPEPDNVGKSGWFLEPVGE